MERKDEQTPTVWSFFMYPRSDWSYERHFSQNFEVGEHFSQGSDQKSARPSERSRSCKHSLHREEIPQHALPLHQWRKTQTLPGVSVMDRGVDYLKLQ